MFSTVRELLVHCVDAGLLSEKAGHVESCQAQIARLRQQNHSRNLSKSYQQNMLFLFEDNAPIYAGFDYQAALDVEMERHRQRVRDRQVAEPEERQTHYSMERSYRAYDDSKSLRSSRAQMSGSSLFSSKMQIKVNEEPKEEPQKPDENAEAAPA